MLHPLQESTDGLGIHGDWQTCRLNSADYSAGPKKKQDGDPVDLSTGLFVDEHTDLLLPDTIPLTLTRTYRQNDPIVRPFGVGMNFDYGMFFEYNFFTYQYGPTFGPQIAPGVPATLSYGMPRYALALKSGNFGGPDFFMEALDALR